MRRKVVESVTLELSQAAILECLAKMQHGGNKSMVVRSLLDQAATQYGIETVSVMKEVKHVEARTARMGA